MEDRNIKLWIGLSLICFLAVTLVSCGTDENGPKDPPPEDTTISKPAPPSPDPSESKDSITRKTIKNTSELSKHSCKEIIHEYEQLVTSWSNSPSTSLLKEIHKLKNDPNFADCRSEEWFKEEVYRLESIIEED
jgi:hypothetical protein